MGQTSTQQSTQTQSSTPSAFSVPTPVIVTTDAKESFIDSLSGKKTYIIAGLMVIYAVSGYLLNDLSQAQAMSLILQALAISGLRNGVGQLQKVVESLLEL